MSLVQDKFFFKLESIFKESGDRCCSREDGYLGMPRILILLQRNLPLRSSHLLSSLVKNRKRLEKNYLLIKQVYLTPKKKRKLNL